MVDQGGVEGGSSLSNPLCCVSLHWSPKAFELESRNRFFVSPFSRPHPTLEASRNKDLMLPEKEMGSGGETGHGKSCVQGRGTGSPHPQKVKCKVTSRPRSLALALIPKRDENVRPHENKHPQEPRS